MRPMRPVGPWQAPRAMHPGANVGAVGHMPGAVPGRARSPPGPVPGMSGVMRSHGPMSPSSQNGARPAYGSNTPTLVGSQRSMVQPQPTPVRSEGARDPREREAVQSVQASRASSVEGGHFRTPSQESHRSSKGPSRVSGSYGAPTHGSLGLQMGPGGPPRSRDESRAAFSSRSPSADSGLHKMQNNLQQSRQQMQEVEQTIAAMKGALESSKDMLKSLKGPAIEQPPLGELPAFDGGYENVLQRLQQHLRDQQAQQHELLTQLTARWEARFTALEQALSSSLEVATVATTSMNERLRRILSLGEVLEGAVERVMSSSKDVAALTRKVGQIEDDVACLAQELASDRSERGTAALAESVRLMEDKINALCHEARASRVDVDRREPAESAGPARPGGSQDRDRRDQASSSHRLALIAGRRVGSRHIGPIEEEEEEEADRVLKGWGDETGGSIFSRLLGQLEPKASVSLRDRAAGPELQVSPLHDIPGLTSSTANGQNERWM
ncbi:unnamed protein product [Effrenium voratum]|nr:unnamed protein product [Effrenium voratum]